MLELFFLSDSDIYLFIYSFNTTSLWLQEIIFLVFSEKNWTKFIVWFGPTFYLVRWS